MSTFTKRRAAQLVEEINSAKVGSYANAKRREDPLGQSAYFLGGLEAVLQYFLREQGCGEAAEALARAMNAVPTDAEIADRIAQQESLFGRRERSAA